MFNKVKRWARTIEFWITVQLLEEDEKQDLLSLMRGMRSRQRQRVVLDPIEQSTIAVARALKVVSAETMPAVKS